MGKKIDKFLLLMWKNFLLQVRHKKQTLIEILAPVVFSALLIVVRSLVEPESFPAKYYVPFKNTMPVLKRLPTLQLIAWSPRCSPLEQVMDDTVKAISKDENVQMKHMPFNNSRALLGFLAIKENQLVALAGVEFSDSFAGATKLDPYISISLRFPGELRKGMGLSENLMSLWNWYTDSIFSSVPFSGPRGPDDNDGASPQYHYEGFLKLQQELSYSLINYFKKRLHKTPFSPVTRPLYMQRFPYPKWNVDKLIQPLQIFAGLTVMLSFLYTCISTVKSITTEKEKQLKEAMKIMGLPNWLHWTAWFIKTFLILLIAIALIVVLLKAKWYPRSDFTVFTYSDPLVIFLFLVCYVCSTITFSFAVSVFFSRANTAATIAGIVWFLSYMPYSFTQYKYDTLSLRQKLLRSLCSNSALGYGFHLTIEFEGIGEGLQWSNVWKTTTPDDNLKFGYVMIMLIVDTLMYLLIALYVELVFPGIYGVPLPWYFPFTCSFWFGYRRNVDAEDIVGKSTENENFEKEPTHLPVGVKIQHLHKRYSNRKVAVHDLSLNIYKNQITVLLGHNGAGKTTVLSMLTGMITPTSGTAVIAGCDIRKDMTGVRESLGLCPQHNILFDEMTVWEHLYFYSRLKGVSKSKTKEEIERYIDMLELAPKTNSMSETLSGGMKRKLSIAVALCGGSSVVFCDEPTAGMDPAARRSLWCFLQNQKEDRTIILTTHFMDEADLLGDRIAIMSGGELQCCGSSFFLKKRYGIGYHLIMEKSPKCNVAKVTELLRKYVPDIKVESNVGSELSYLLGGEKSSVFETLFGDLEKNSNQLGISSFGISLTTLEEVFLKVGSDKSREEDTMEQSQTLHTDTFGIDENLSINLDTKLLTGCLKWINQLLAMFMKRALSLKRSFIFFIIHVCFPVVALALAIIVIRMRQFETDVVSLKITLDSYSDPVTVVTTRGNFEYSEKYKDYFKINHKILLDWHKGNLSVNIYEKTKHNPPEVRMRYICGASFNADNSTTAWFNNDPLHSPPLTLQLVMNAILQAEISPKHYIQIFNYPLPFSLNTEVLQLKRIHYLGFEMAFNLGFTMAFVSAFYVIFCTKERASKSKHLQFLSGVHILIFWFATFICDVLTFIFIIFCIIVTFLSFQEAGYSTLGELERVVVIFLCFGFSMLPMMYLISYFFDVPASAYTRVTLMNLFTGVAAFLIIEILKLPSLDMKHASDTLHWIFLLVPLYSVTAGLKDMHFIFATHKICDTVFKNCINSTLIPSTPKECKIKMCKVDPSCCSMTKNYYDWEEPGIGRNIVFSCSLGAFLIVILLLIEYRIFEKIGYICKGSQARSPLPSIENEDDDVLNEKRIVRNATIEEIKKHSLVMRDVTKWYGNFLAVNQLCLSADKYECFGLLGINGAGKTTTFKIMTGDISFTSGDAWTSGLNLRTQIKKIRPLIGYCPQFDALLDDLTCRETLIIFSMLRGITIRDSKLMAKKLALDFDFYRHIDKAVKQLSGGNKRKLSTALAVVGDPLVVYLDEPSTGSYQYLSYLGMDPATKRHLWDALCKVRDSGKCMILTSHSMEECEALCTRLAIMVNGTFMCLGSTQHLKSKFSEGYILIVKVERTGGSEQAKISKIEAFVMTSFPSAIIREKHQELLTFYIADKKLPWSKMFGIMERGKKSLDIEDYSLGQCSLEQVFLSFTKYQNEDILA